MGFWEVHGWFGGFFFILFLLFLPRLTVLFSVSLAAIVASVITEFFGLDGFLGWITIFFLTIIGWTSWLLVPRHLIAVIATILYWDLNQILVIVSWLLAYIIFEAQKAVIIEFIKKAREKLREQEAAQDYTSAGYQQRRQSTSAESTVQQWWRILGVSPDASAEVIKSAYRKAAIKWHPDRDPDGEGDPEQFRQATEAYKKGMRRNGR